MFNWLKNKADKIKFYMCCKETLWFLQNLSVEECSTLILISAFNYHKYMRNNDEFDDKVNNLKRLSYDNLLRLYLYFENHRNNCDVILSHLKDHFSDKYSERTIQTEKMAIAYHKIGINLLMCKISSLLDDKSYYIFKDILSILMNSNRDLAQGLNHPFIFDSTSLLSETISISQIPKEALLEIGKQMLKTLSE